MNVTELDFSNKTPLNSEQLEHLEDRGFLCFPSFLENQEIDVLKEATDLMMDARKIEGSRGFRPTQQSGLVELATHPRVMALLSQIFDSEFAMHHYHGVRQEAGCGGVHWHHDYEQHPQSNRNGKMFHVFFYLDGLNGTVGDLMLIPGTQHRVMSRDALTDMGTEDMPGSKVVDDIPPGTIVIVHSALFHARRAKPGGEGKPRYFLDIPYCQAGVKWPQDKGWAAELDRLSRERSSIDPWAEKVFNSNHFYRPGPVGELLANYSGSMGYELLQKTTLLETSKGLD